jgi:glycosyltransferase involved in cell wall biosynthesis
MSRVSIIIAAYNGAKYLHETIDSLLNQSEKDIEVLVIDDGSTDKTAEIVKSFIDSHRSLSAGEIPACARMTKEDGNDPFDFAQGKLSKDDREERDERIKYFYQKNSGSPASPRNVGIKKAAGAFVGFCDQDDIYYLEKLEKQIKAYEECKDRDKIGIIISSADLIDESGRVVSQNIKPFEGFMGSKEAYELLLRGDFITACSALVPRKIFDEIGYLDESLKGVDDYDLWLRISQRYGILTIKEPLCAWRQGKEAMSADKAKQYIETEKVFKKLEKEDKGERIRVGHSKNLMRIFIAKNLEKDFAYAEDLLSKLKKYPITKKGQIVISVFELSHSLSFWFLRFLQLIGRVSL